MSKTVSERELRILEVLTDHYCMEGNCLYFSYIGKLTSLDRSQVKRSVRSLARKGFAEYVRGLFDDDGMVAGSGYCATRAGVDFFNTKPPPPSLP